MRSSRRPRRSSKRRRYGAKATPPWMSTARFGQRSVTSGCSRLTSSKRIKSHDGMPDSRRRSCPATRRAAAASLVSQSGIDDTSRPGEYRPRSPGGSWRATRPDRSPTRPFTPIGDKRVHPPRNSIGPPSRCCPPTFAAASSRASQPPLRWDANASSVTGIVLSPAVVPDVFVQYRGRPGHVTSRSPSRTRVHSGRKSRYWPTPTRAW